MANVTFWGKFPTKALVSHLQLSLFERSFARKLRFHIFNFYFLREVSQPKGFCLYGAMIVPPPNLKGRICEKYVSSDILPIWCHDRPPLPNRKGRTPEKYVYSDNLLIWCHDSSPPPNLKGHIPQKYVSSDILPIWCHDRSPLSQPKGPYPSEVCF